MRILGLIAGILLLNGCNTVGLRTDPVTHTVPAMSASPPPAMTTAALAAGVHVPADARPVGNLARPPTIWQRIRAGFRLPDRDHPRIRNDLRWYARHPEYIERVMQRAEPFLHLIVEEIRRRGMPTEIALLPAVESAFQPFAYSHGRAAGIWQFIPSTGRRFGLRQNWWYDGRRDVIASTHAALDLLQRLHKRFKGDWLLALAAYNSGAGTVARAIRFNRRLGRKTDFWHLYLPRETRGYVPKLLALSNIVATPEKYGIRLRPIIDAPYLAKVRTGSQIDLALAAELAGLDIREIYRLNPGFNRWATDPAGPHYLLLPVTHAKRFRERFARLPASRRLKWKRHRIRPGESLIAIARRYRTSVALIRRINRIRGHAIRAGRHLIIPVARKNLRHYSLAAEQRLRRLQRSGKGYRHVHTVRPGDNLWNLSRTYRVSVRRLAKWNGMAPRDHLRPGQKLVIWRKRPARPGHAALLGRNPLAQRRQAIYYTVRRGDSLARIASRFRVTIRQLKRWNRIRGRYLQPGQRLTVYVDVTRQSGSV